MDQTYLLVLAVAVIIVLAVVGRLRERDRAASPGSAAESPFAVSTEGMKICPSCGMGNLWTDRTCMSCQAPLRG